jgi:hypothetical protein
MHVGDWAIAFLLTLAVEMPVYVLTTRQRLGFAAAILVGLGLNVATHPIAWTAIMLTRGSFPYAFLAIEGMVVLVEGALLFAVGRSRFARQPLTRSTCFAIALAANGFSAGLGLLL